MSLFESRSAAMEVLLRFVLAIAAFVFAFTSASLLLYERAKSCAEGRLKRPSVMVLSPISAMFAVTP